MNNIFFRTWLPCIAVALMSSPVWSWTSEGHESAGAIADRLLAGTRAGREVRRILGGKENLQTAAVWADCVKGVSEQPPYRYSNDPRYPECAPYSSRSGRRAMEAYVRRNLDACVPGPGDERCHRQYHYVNLAMQREAYAPGQVGATGHDVVAAIRACIRVLRGERAPAPFDLRDKREALRLLAHLVGDIHQPLHVGSVYLDAAGHVVDPDVVGAAPASFTRGGNSIRVGSQNLHGVWDVVPDALQKPQFAASIGQDVFDAIPRSRGPIEDWPQQWAGESLRLSREAFAGVQFGVEQDAGTPAQRWIATLPQDYAQVRERIQRERLIDAGVRLAELLQALWP